MESAHHRLYFIFTVTSFLKFVNIKKAKHLLFTCSSLTSVMRYVTLYMQSMIVSFQHKGLKAFFETESKKGIQAAHDDKLRQRLTVLNVIKRVTDFPKNLATAWGLHQLHGDLKGHNALSVSGNWRLTFTFDGENVALLDYQDYH